MHPRRGQGGRELRRPWLGSIPVVLEATGSPVPNMFLFDTESLRAWEGLLRCLVNPETNRKMRHVNAEGHTGYAASVDDLTARVHG